MSLFSEFFAAEAGGQPPDLELLRSKAAGTVDFSGGISRPFLFPDDFLELTGEGTDSFWRLETGSLLEGEECGLYRVPEAECEKILGLDPARLARFSDTWNRRQSAAEAVTASSSAGWKNEAFLKIAGGTSAGLAIAYLANGRPLDLLIGLAAWLVGSVGVAFYLSKRSRRRRSAPPFDWVGPLQALQALLRKARELRIPVYYHWSL